MFRPPPRSTLPHTIFPYLALCLSEPCDCPATGEHLQGAATEHHPAQRPEPLGIAFEPDNEQHQDDTDFGEFQNRLYVSNELEPPRADHAPEIGRAQV